ncbi:MAG: Plug domain-containing protein, partial [Proteobacteria bacterium]|nr:Plug domain-containing protein [Pseudomonadota bacterium]
MNLNTNKLVSAVRFGLAIGAAATAGTTLAQNADSADSKARNLETIVVTGSNIRRVDMETANPVITIDHAAISKSGKTTLGDIVQDLPAIAGNANNTNVNNGGGSGQANVSLRGLGSVRSLVLIDGRRLQIGGTTADVNAIPANLIERIEVLTDGASAIYGSDAIGG